MTFNVLRWLPLCAAFLFIACGGDDDGGGTTDDPISSFQFEVSADNFLEVTFSNFSQDADSYVWDFGDGNMSTAENPTHEYGASGDYTVTLTASAGDQSATSSKDVTITDPNEAAALLTGASSKTWKLFREGTAMSLGSDADNPASFWAGLTNDGSRPCLYEQEYTFSADGTYEFDDMGMFWGEFGVFNNVPECTVNNLAEGCYDKASNPMINACGDDVSAWGSGTYSFSYDPSIGELTVTGEGAFLGIPKLGTTGAVLTPESSVTAQVSIEEFTGYDVMSVVFDYGDNYWPIKFASYSDTSLEPDVVTEQEEFGEDLPDVTPTEITHSFASAEGFAIDTIVSGSTVDFGVEDPADAMATPVGQFNRTGDRFQELQFQTSPEKLDIQFDNLSTASVEVYLPSSNDYTGMLTKDVRIGFGDRSQTEQWWTDLTEYFTDGSALAEDQWHTITVDLTMPTFVANPDNGATVKERTKYDMMYIQIGGGDHEVAGTFYVRNLSVQ